MKTLKDIIHRYGNPMGLADRIEKDLKDETIRWIKELQSSEGRGFCLSCQKVIKNYEENHDNHIELIESDPYEPMGPNEAIKWIKISSI